MTETQQTPVNATPLRYRGFNSHYVDIAARGIGVTDANEFLGLSVEYAVHPNGVGCFIIRFVVHGKGVDPKNYKHLMYRESAKFLVPATEVTGAEMFKGVRLNKIAIPLFEPAVGKHEVAKYAEKFGVWGLLTEWIAEQVQAEGFTLTVDLAKELRTLAVGADAPEDSVKSVISFPDLDSPEMKHQALKLVQKPEPEEDEADDLDEDEDDEKKDWMN